MSGNYIIYEFENFQLNPLEKKLYRDCEEIELEEKEFEVLLLLVKNAGTPLNKEFILSEVWRDVFVEESAVTVRISILRRKLDPHDRKKFIKTERKTGRKGYRFIVEVRLVEKPVQPLISGKEVGEAAGNEPELQTVAEEYFSAPAEPAFSIDAFIDEPDRLSSYHEPNSKQKYKFGVLIASLFTCGLISFFFAHLWLESKKPRLEKADFVTKPIPNNQFYMRLTGKNLSPDTVRLKVMGPGCGGDNPCTVSNGPLRLFGQITERAIEKAPLKLAQGEYHIWLENDAGYVSNKLTIIVPDADHE